jgi:hypothetical protein
MLPANFANLIGNHPNDARALRVILEWIYQHDGIQVIYPSVLSRETSLDPVSIAKGLSILAKEGLLRRVYKVTTPTGVLADEEFNDPRDIPPRLPDRFNHYFSTAESDVVPVFQMVA